MDTGVYWGYTVRIAKSLSDIFSKSPYDTSYDLTIGTSDKGDNVHNVKKASLKFNHALIVYGGLTVKKFITGLLVHQFIYFFFIFTGFRIGIRK